MKVSDKNNTRVTLWIIALIYLPRDMNCHRVWNAQRSKVAQTAKFKGIKKNTDKEPHETQWIETIPVVQNIIS